MLEIQKIELRSSIQMLGKNPLNPPPPPPPLGTAEVRAVRQEHVYGYRSRV